MKGKLNLLQDLWLSNCIFGEGFDAFEVAHSLATLTSRNGTGSQTPLPWKQIRSLQIRFSTLPIALQELSSAPESIEVELHCCNLRTQRNATHITHDLRSLSIVVDTEDPDVHHWFDWLTLPRLTSLTIAGDKIKRPSYRSVDDSFPSFLSRSSCTITSLSLVDLPISDVDAIVLLSLLPLLSSLTIHEHEARPFKNSIITARLLDALVVDRNNIFSDRRPSSLHTKRLQSLDLRLHATLPAKAISQVVESRWTSDAEYSAVVGVDDLRTVKVLVLRSTNRTVLDVDELLNSLDWIKRAGLQLICASRRSDRDR
ncbi:hypothetical protein D9758_008255 [Tetrapyrgos nigripes]|uniref:Uncharacterized protein n=1 Tax=Tetrapyrgos nigripes TaxID=182062 RepID=A0A8H5G1K8_9AGAR|nr:hypothetical protein D9758_008255 [Tetrapyrgos nigripes]